MAKLAGKQSWKTQHFEKMTIHFETFRTTSLLKYWGQSGAKVCKSCRSRQELSQEIAIHRSIYYLLAKIGFDIAENEPLKVWR